MDAAAAVCAKENVEFSSLDASSMRGIMFYWCSTCSKIYPLTELLISTRSIKCGYCKERVRLYTNSNKFGKLRKSVLYRLIELGIFKKEMTQNETNEDNRDTNMIN